MINLSGKKCLVDTNVLVALLNDKHQNHKQAVSFFEKIKENGAQIVISIQNLFELTAVLVHGYGLNRKEVAKDINIISRDPLLQVIYPDFRVMDKFIQLIKNGNKLHVADLYLLATLEVFEIQVLVTGDKAFARIKNSSVSVYNPFC